MNSDGTPEKGANGPKAFAGVTAVLAVVAGLYAMYAPSSQRMDFHEKLLETAKGDLNRHQATEGHAVLSSRMAAVMEKFTEVETQFDALRDLTDARLDALEENLGRAIDWQTSDQWDRIKALEELAYRGK